MNDLVVFEICFVVGQERGRSLTAGRRDGRVTMGWGEREGGRRKRRKEWEKGALGINFK